MLAGENVGRRIWDVDETTPGNRSANGRDLAEEEDEEEEEGLDAGESPTMESLRPTNWVVVNDVLGGRIEILLRSISG